MIYLDSNIYFSVVVEAVIPWVAGEASSHHSVGYDYQLLWLYAQMFFAIDLFRFAQSNVKY